LAWLVGIGIQICALSMTVPILFEPVLFHCFGISTYETICI
jgi:hypothetical protein